MSYQDDRFCVISLGCSCQTAYQINANADFIAEILGRPEGRATSAYFDWLITPSPSLKTLADQRLPVPHSLSELDLSRGAPEFISAGSLFYHEFLTPTNSYELTAAGLEALCTKFEHLAEKTREMIRGLEPIFIWSNTQGNLLYVANQCDRLDIILTDEVIDVVIEAGRSISKSRGKFLFVSTPDRCTASRVRDGVEIRLMPLDDSSWTGSEESWRLALGGALPALLSV